MHIFNLLQYSAREVQKEENNRIQSKNLINKTSVDN